MTARLTHSIKNNPLTAFIIMTFGITYTSVGLGLLVEIPASIEWLLHPLAISGPTLSAIIITRVMGGKKGVERFLGRTLQWRFHAGWYLFAAFISLVVGLTAIGLLVAMGGAAPELKFIFPAAAFMAGIPEEYGWRGFLLPYLQKNYNALTSAVIVGIIHVLWHVSLTPIGSIGITMFLLFALEVVILSILMTWIYNNTGGSMLFPVLYHFAIDLIVFNLKIPTQLPLMTIYVTINLLIAIVIVVRYGPENLSKKERFKLH